VVYGQKNTARRSDRGGLPESFKKKTNSNMNFLPMPMLACGPNEGMVILILTVYGGAAIAVLSFLGGGILCLWGQRGVGLTMMSLSSLLGIALFFWLRMA
jgi:hypothetical protein